jgi:hypothetical protein
MPQLVAVQAATHLHPQRMSPASSQAGMLPQTGYLGSMQISWLEQSLPEKQPVSWTTRSVEGGLGGGSTSEGPQAHAAPRRQDNAIAFMFPSPP